MQTPGGTPIPPPPPSTPMTVTASGSPGASPNEVEEPSKLVTKLPPLAASKGQDAAVVAGDWLAQLEPSMSSLSSSASLWWQSMMSKVRVLYTKWLESTPVPGAEASDSSRCLSAKAPCGPLPASGAEGSYVASGQSPR